MAATTTAVAGRCLFGVVRRVRRRAAVALGAGGASSARAAPAAEVLPEALHARVHVALAPRHDLAAARQREARPLGRLAVFARYQVLSIEAYFGALARQVLQRHPQQRVAALDLVAALLVDVADDGRELHPVAHRLARQHAHLYRCRAHTEKTGVVRICMTS